MKYIKLALLIFGFGVLFAGCLKEETPQSEIDEQNLVAYLNSKHISAVRDQYGYYYSIVDSGQGEVITDSTVIKLDMAGESLSGTSYGDTLLYRAVNNFSYALRLGITKVKVGGEINLYVPAYMNDGSSGIALNCKPTNKLENQLAADDSIINNYLKLHRITATKDPLTGIYSSISVSGSNSHPVVSSQVTVKYTGRLATDDIFDQTVGLNVYTNTLSQLILGWQYSVPTLGVGGKGRFYIPSYLGYGNVSYSEIPANSVLIFDIELVSFK